MWEGYFIGLDNAKRAGKIIWGDWGCRLSKIAVFLLNFTKRMGLAFFLTVIQRSWDSWEFGWYRTLSCTLSPKTLGYNFWVVLSVSKLLDITFELCSQSQNSWILLLSCALSLKTLGYYFWVVLSVSKLLDITFELYSQSQNSLI